MIDTMKKILLFSLFTIFGCAKGSSGLENNANNLNNVNNVNNYNNIDGFGDVCMNDSECDSGYCIDFPDSNDLKCTATCSSQDCPNGFSCRKASRDDNTTICLPISLNVCAECSEDSQCGDYSDRCFVMDHFGGCLMDCSVQAYCQPGFVCTDSVSSSGVSGSYCKPSSGGCGCSASNAGIQTSCTNENSFGICEGVKECLGDSGWGQCDAYVAVAEVCDGVDNNCDGEIDEDLRGTIEHCEACNVACAGQGTVGTTVACIAETCTSECQTDYYDIDGQSANGCECTDDSLGGESTSGAYDLGSFTDCDFTHPVNNLHIPVVGSTSGHVDYFRYAYENDGSVFCWNYNYITLSVPSSGVSMRLCAGHSTTESSWPCITVAPGGNTDIFLPEIENGESVTVYFKVENLGTGNSCGDYNLIIYDDGDL
jgi:Putative metal-binding motif